MRAVFLAVLVAITTIGSAAASAITSTYTSFYVLGDSLSDDGNLAGPVWYYATGGSPYSGSFWSNGRFTNGKVWNQSLQGSFRSVGRDADNFAVAKAQSSGGDWLFPDLGRQIGRLMDSTSSKDRGPNGLASIWIGANNILDTLSAGGDAIKTAISAANRVASGARSLARDAGIDDVLLFNLPDFGKIPKYNLFETARRSAATAAASAYNARLAQNAAALELEGINVIEIDVFSLFEGAIADPAAYGFSNVTLPCVFPSSTLAKKYGQSTRCSSDTANKRLFIDEVHPNALAHQVIGNTVRSAIEADILARSAISTASARITLATAEGPVPVPTPLPGSGVLLLAALAGWTVVTRRVAEGPGTGVALVRRVGMR